MSAPQGAINLPELASICWRRKWWILLPTLAATLLAVAYALLVTPRYRAETVLIQREMQGVGSLSGQLAQFGGLAELAGVDLGEGQRQEPMGVLRSRGFARRFIEQNQLASELAAGGSADAPAEDIRLTVDRFKRRVLSVSEDKKAGLVTLAVEWRDPVLAARWANAMVRQINAEMRQKALAEAKRNIEYLQRALAETESVALQQAVARLLEREMQNAMLAEGALDYAFRVVDEAQPPVKRSFPKRSMLVLLAFAFSLALSVGGAVVVDRWPRKAQA